VQIAMDNTNATLRSILTQHKEAAKIYTSLLKEGNSAMLIVQSVGQNLVFTCIYIESLFWFHDS
jgi:hypothetical protein